MMALEVATTLSLPLPCRLSHVTGAIATASAAMAMVRAAVALAPALLVAVSTKLTLAGPLGAVKLGVKVVAANRVTSGPALCVHLKPAPLDTAPTKVTMLPAMALAGAFNVALGGTAAGLVLTVSFAIEVRGTVLLSASVKLKTAAVVTVGALKLALAVVAPVNCTAGPPVWVQR